MFKHLVRVFIGRQTASVYRIDAAKVSHTSHKKTLCLFKSLVTNRKFSPPQKKQLFFQAKKINSRIILPHS